MYVCLRGGPYSLSTYCAMKGLNWASLSISRFQVGFMVEDIHAAREELLAKGVNPVSEIQGGPSSEAYWCYFEDPEGNLFEITQKL